MQTLDSFSLSVLIIDYIDNQRKGSQKTDKLIRRVNSITKAFDPVLSKMDSHEVALFDSIRLLKSGVNFYFPRLCLETET